MRDLPSVQRVLETAAARALADRTGHGPAVTAIRAVIAEARGDLLAGRTMSAPDAESLGARSVLRVAAMAPPVTRRVINATGIVLHTNLGRAPLAAEALRAVVDAARSYAAVEYDLESGTRGRRGAGVEALLCALTGAEAALAVNNGAAALLLALSCLAAGAEVVVSNGELVEIGGGFRIPEVIAQGGARLVPVGCTNRTRAEDYAAAITPATRILLKVHQSNFRQTGFVGSVAVPALAALARRSGAILVVDLGSGQLAGRIAGEPSVRDTLRDGADLVTFSGDKLLGGPQAGLLAGTAAAVAPLRRHPLLRALRPDKMSLAALEATLALHRDRPGRLPTVRMLEQDIGAIAARAGRLRALAGAGTVVESDSYAGGGALPGTRLPSWAVAVAPDAGGAEALARGLRLNRPPIVGRLHDGAVLLDMRTVHDAELPAIAAALVRLRATKVPA